MPRTLAPQMPPLQGLVSWWRCRDSDFGTTTLTNEVSGGPNLTLSAPIWGNTGGKNYLAFLGGANAGATNGGIGSASVAAGSLLDLGSATALTVIILADSFGTGGNANGRVLELGSVSSNIVSLIILGSTSGATGTTNNNLKTVSGTGGFNAWGGSGLLTTRPAVLAWTYSATDNIGRLISNGVEAGTDTTHLSGALLALPSSSSIFLGSQVTNASQFNGRVYEVAIFKNVQLTAAQTLAFMQARRPVY